MKSLLVDALRRANKGETNGTLSDSGSFDATRGDFGLMANDESAVTEPPVDADAPAETELELLDASEAEKNDALGENPDGSTASNDALELDIADTDNADIFQTQYASANTDQRSVAVSIRTVSSAAPLLARYAPLFCACLALTAAVLWSFFLNIDERHSATALGAAFAESRHSYPVEGIAPVSHAERFPFLSASKTSAEQEAPE